MPSLYDAVASTSCAMAELRGAMGLGVADQQRSAAVGQRADSGSSTAPLDVMFADQQRPALGGWVGMQLDDQGMAVDWPGRMVQAGGEDEWATSSSSEQEEEEIGGWGTPDSAIL